MILFAFYGVQQDDYTCDYGSTVRVACGFIFPFHPFEREGGSCCFKVTKTTENEEA